MTVPTHPDDGPRARDAWAAGFVALGGYALLLVGVFLLPLQLNPWAGSNDVYMRNGFYSPAYGLVGAICLLAGVLISASFWRRWRPWARALLVSTAGAAIIALVYAQFGGQFHSEDAHANDWAPYLTEQIMVLSVPGGVAVFIGAGVWQRRSGGRETAARASVRVRGRPGVPGRPRITITGTLPPGPLVTAAHGLRVRYRVDPGCRAGLY